MSETQRATLRNGQSITLATSGMWQLALRVDGATDDLARTYWVGVPAVVTTIETDNATPFEHHLLVLATASDPTARIYHVGDNWIPVPDRTVFEVLPPALATMHDPNARADRSTREARIPSRRLLDGLPVIKVQAGDPEQGRHTRPLAITIEASHDSADQVIVYYSRDGSIPDEGSSSFVSRTHFDVVEEGNYLITCGAKTPDGTWFYQSFCYSIGQ